MSFFLFFVYFLLPAPAILLALLLIPFPRAVKSRILKVTDSVLFVKVHPSIPFLSLFWLVFSVSVVTLMHCMSSYWTNDQLFRTIKQQGGNSRESLVKLLASERNLWIAICATSIWIVLHRHRHLQKQYTALEVQLESKGASKKKI